MTSINIVLRPSTKKGRHPGSLSLRVIHDRKVKTTATGCHLYAEEWDASRQSVIYPFSSERIAYLEDTQTKLSACREMAAGYIAVLEKHGSYSAEDVIKKLSHKKDDSKLMGYVESLAADLERGEQFRLLGAYRTVSKALVKYNDTPDLPLSNINATLIKGFETDLMKRGLKPNTISYYMRNLRAIYNKAVASRRITSKAGDPFAGVNTKIHPAAKRALTVDEMTRLYEIDFEAMRAQHSPGTPEREYVESLYYSWRLFMFCFFAQGMSFIDMAYLRKENIKNGVCIYYRKKTRKQVEVRVHKGMQQIIDSFAADVKGSPYLFPVLKSQDSRQARAEYETALRNQNRRLKVLAKLADVDKPLTTHVSRHSFATIVRGGGLPAGVISEMLGHTTEKMTHNYFASFDRSYSDQAYDILVSLFPRPPGGMAVAAR